jgi:hypothetical protein
MTKDSANDVELCRSSWVCCRKANLLEHRFPVLSKGSCTIASREWCCVVRLAELDIYIVGRAGDADVDVVRCVDRTVTLVVEWVAAALREHWYAGSGYDDSHTTR